MKIIPLELTEWEIIVLRAAVEAHAKNFSNPKHVSACQEIMRKSRLHDNPFGALKKK